MLPELLIANDQVVPDRDKPETLGGAPYVIAHQGKHYTPKEGLNLYPSELEMQEGGKRANPHELTISK